MAVRGDRQDAAWQTTPGRKAMRRRIGRVAVLAAVTVLSAAATANAAVTLGSSAMPASSTPSPCGPGVVIGQATSDASTPYAVPAGGGTVTGWSTNTTGSVAGASVTFLVLRPAGSGTYTVVGVDTETLPTP